MLSIGIIDQVLQAGMLAGEAVGVGHGSEWITQTLQDVADTVRCDLTGDIGASAKGRTAGLAEHGAFAALAFGEAAAVVDLRLRLHWLFSPPDGKAHEDDGRRC
jgi:hypothetical protein